MLRVNRPAIAACVLSAVLVPLSSGCLSGGGGGGYYPPPTDVAQAPVPTTSGEAEPTPADPATEPGPVAQDGGNLPEDPALVEDHYADLEFGGPETGFVGFPPNATVVNGGQGDLWFKATARGRVFVYDTEARRVVASARVREGQAVDVRPGRGVVTVDGETQFLQYELDRRHKHQVLFAEWQSGPGVADGRDGWRRDGDRDGRPGSRGGHPLRESIERAKVVAKGRGDLSFLARSKGVLYVRDLTTGNIVRMAPVPARTRVTVNPRRDEVKASNGTVWPTQLDRDHAHALLWDERGSEDLERAFRRQGTARIE